MDLRIKKISYVFVLVASSLLIYFPFIGEVNLFDLDETLWASISKEMLIGKNYLELSLNTIPFYDKPPLFIWMQAFCMKYMGISEFGSRFPNAICGLLAILSLFKIGKRLFSTNFGMLWALIYMSIFLPQMYHKSGLIEPWFNFFVFLSLYNLSRVIEMKQELGDGFYRRSDISRSLFWSALACFGAIMIKGVEGYFIVVLSYWFVFVASSAKYGMGYVNLIRWTLLVSLFIGIWAFLDWRFHGGHYFVSFVQYQLSELNIAKAQWNSRIYFHLVVLLIGCFPASVFAFNSLSPKTYENVIQKVFRLMLFGFLIVTLLIVTFIKSKIVHYSSLTYYPLTFMAAYSIDYIFRKEAKIKWGTYTLLIVVGAFWGAVLLLVPYTKAHISFLHKFVNDPILEKVFFNTYNWQFWEYSVGYLYAILFITAILLLILKHYKVGIVLLFININFVSQFLLIFYTPKIEFYSQNSLIEFVKLKSDSNTIVYNHHFKSYASSFYGYGVKQNYDQLPLDSFYKKFNGQKKIYLITKTNDTSGNAFITKKMSYMYSQGFYAFYHFPETRKNKKRKIRN
jgi:4-amino-4-deoxy-L-arabinose transferase-like glycosyltransferase